MIASVEIAFEQASDLGFRARSISEYRSIRYWVQNKINWDKAKVLDFGCGHAIAANSIALRHPFSDVVGVDILELDRNRLEKDFRQQTGLEIPRNFRYNQIKNGVLPDDSGFDLIYAWSVFEHIPSSKILSILKELRSRLAHNGLLFLQVDPLYFSPRGSHLYEYFKTCPWHHLLLSIDEIREIVIPNPAIERNSRGWQQFLELNRLTGPQIIEQGKSAGLNLIREQFFKTDQTPPQSLLNVYNEEALLTNGFQALYRR